MVLKDFNTFSQIMHESKASAIRPNHERRYGCDSHVK